MLYQDLIGQHIWIDEPVISDRKQEYTYGQLDDMVSKFVQVMEDCHVKKNSRVVLVNHNTIDTVTAILTCIRLQICFVIVPEQISKEQLDYIVEDSQAVLLVDEKLPETVKIFARRKEIECREKLLDIVYILYTSGSTGNPKGVMAPRRQVSFCIDAINEFLQNGPEDRILCSLPLSFDYGLYQLFFALKFRSHLTLLHGALIQQIAQILKGERITGFPAMPAMLNMLMKTKLLQNVELPHLRYITSTGDSFPVELIQKLHSLFPDTSIIPMYGLTECKRVAIMPQDRWDKILQGSCGIPLNGTKVFLDQIDGEGVGELIVAGENVMAGYWNDTKITRENFFRNAEGVWCLRTGDLFKIDEEGFLFFCGRQKRILKVNGYRIGCLELEERLQKIISDQVIELKVLGIPAEIEGERIIICVNSRISEEELIRYVKEAVADWPQYQKPYGIYVTDALFKENANGKVDELQLKGEVIQNGYIRL